MRTDRAVSLLSERIAEGRAANDTYEDLEEWKRRAAATLRAVVNPTNPLLAELDKVSFFPSAWFDGMDERPSRVAGRRQGLSILRLSSTSWSNLADAEPTDESAFDPSCGGHVAELVTSKRWDTLASQAMICFGGSAP